MHLRLDLMQWVKIVSGVAVAAALIYWIPQALHSVTSKKRVTPVQASQQLFTPHYPASLAFQRELTLLRHQKRLVPMNEILINHSIAEASFEMQIPRSLLWCLFFQESRLNHLLGLGEDRTIHGLGQFSYFAFYEVNKQLLRFNPKNLEHMTHLLDHDVRPIAALRDKLTHPSSYFSIPTAVTASSIYLKNRYRHLGKLLRERSIPFDPELLWLHSALAYNKGARSILSLWNEIQRLQGPEALTNTLTDRNAFFALHHQESILTSALSRIWPEKEAIRYAKELSIHAQNIQNCSTTAGITEEEDGSQ